MLQNIIQPFGTLQVIIDGSKAFLHYLEHCLVYPPTCSCCVALASFKLASLFFKLLFMWTPDDTAKVVIYFQLLYLLRPYSYQHSTMEHRHIHVHFYIHFPHFSYLRQTNRSQKNPSSRQVHFLPLYLFMLPSCQYLDKFGDQPRSKR